MQAASTPPTSSLVLNGTEDVRSYRYADNLVNGRPCTLNFGMLAATISVSLTGMRVNLHAREDIPELGDYKLEVPWDEKDTFEGLLDALEPDPGYALKAGIVPLADDKFEVSCSGFGHAASICVYVGSRHVSFLADGTKLMVMVSRPDSPGLLRQQLFYHEAIPLGMGRPMSADELNHTWFGRKGQLNPLLTLDGVLYRILPRLTGNAVDENGLMTVITAAEGAKSQTRHIKVADYVEFDYGKWSIPGAVAHVMEMAISFGPHSSLPVSSLTMPRV